MQPYRVKLLPLTVWFSRLRFNGGRTVKSALTMPVGRSTWIGVMIAVALVLAVIGLIAHTWAAIGDTAISRAGGVAIALGVLATLGLGTGLMSLVFISNRKGFDEAAGGVTRIGWQSAPPSRTPTLAGADSKIAAG